MCLEHKHNTNKLNKANYDSGTAHDHTCSANASHNALEPEPIQLLSNTKNTIVTVTIPQHEETIVNGKYIVESEDDKYYYAYHQRAYKVKILKDEYKAKITTRDSKGRLLPGFSLVKDSVKDDTVKVKKRPRKYTSKSAEKWLHKELLPSLIEDLESGEIPATASANIKKDLLNYVKATMAKITVEKEIKIINNEFDDAVVENDTDKNKNDD